MTLERIKTIRKSLNRPTRYFGKLLQQFTKSPQEAEKLIGL